jgi:transposase
MHRDPKQWAYVRRLILEDGHSRRGVSRKTGLSRSTVRKMLKSPQPPHRTLPPDNVDRKLIESAHFLAAERLITDPSVYRRRTLCLWSRARELVLKLDRRRGAALLQEIAELVNGNTTPVEANAKAGTTLSRRGIRRARGLADRDWMDRLLRGALLAAEIAALKDVEGLALLLATVKSGPLRQRQKAVAVLAHRWGVPIRTIAGHLSISRVSIRNYVRAFGEGGAENLFARRKRIGGRRAQDEQVRRAVFALLHEPPSALGINRTTRRMADLTMTLRERGTPVCAQVVREITRSAGWRWRKARKVLTSNDPGSRHSMATSATVSGTNHVRHVGKFPELEDQILNFSTAGYLGDRSPDSADALVWAMSDLLVEPMPGEAMSAEPQSAGQPPIASSSACTCAAMSATVRRQGGRCLDRGKTTYWNRPTEAPAPLRGFGLWRRAAVRPSSYCKRDGSPRS